MIRVALIPGSYRPDRCAVAQHSAHLRAAVRELGIHCVVLTTHDAAGAADIWICVA
jgi:hypothetical protein